GPVKDDGTEDEAAAPLSRIVLLEDEDGDGVMDKRTVFADRLQFCHSFMPLMDGILAGAQTEILFLKDTDGDNVADVREVWFDGFTPAHPQMQIGCPRWGMDNWIYLTYAPGEVRCRRPGFETKEAVKMPRQDMRFDPLTMEFEPVSGLGQFGNTVDNDGNRFFCTNRNPIMMEMIPQQLASLNPLVSVGTRHTDVGPSGGDTRVYPLVAMKSNWLSHAGTHTSACGVTAYRGDLWDTAFQHSVFACEPVGHLVTRSVVEPQPNSPALTAHRARPKADFLASTDTWFRPASLRTGPDGALYLADMYRMWVEHPKFLPPEIAARIDWRAGEDRGRIWRIMPEQNASPAQDFVPLESSRQIALALNDTNGWRRSTARRLVSERQLKLSAEDFQAARAAADGSCSVELLSAVAESTDPWGEALRDVLPDIADTPAKRRWLIRFIVAHADTENEFWKHQILMRAGDRDPSVRHQVALATPQLKTGGTAEALQRIVQGGPLDHWLSQAVLLASQDSGDSLISTVVRSDGAAEQSQLLYDLATVVGKKGDPQQVGAVLQLVAEGTAGQPATQTAILTGLARALPRHAGSLKARSLEALLADPPTGATKAVPVIQGILDSAAGCAIDPSRSDADRVAAIRLLSSQSADTIVTTVVELLHPGESTTVQIAAIDAVRSTSRPEIAESLLKNWPGLAPAVRSQALTLLLARPNTTLDLLKAMTSGLIAPAVVDIDQRVRLLQHRDEGIRQLAGEIFGGVVSANRRAVADEYKAAVTMKSSAERGAVVFEKTCSKCHRIRGKGHNVGPDISDTRNRSRDALLYDILDPNRRVDPQFSEYIVVTTDGRTFNGLLVSDSSGQIVLRQPEGKEQTIARSDIEELQATNKSLMPEGIEKDVTVEQMADLLEFLKGR
ncbi:MAG: c-type cytochrome, partial [Fuerstiella sp.]